MVISDTEIDPKKPTVTHPIIHRDYKQMTLSHNICCKIIIWAYINLMYFFLSLNAISSCSRACMWMII